MTPLTGVLSKWSLAMAANVAVQNSTRAQVPLLLIKEFREFKEFKEFRSLSRLFCAPEDLDPGHVSIEGEEVVEQVGLADGLASGHV